VIFPEDMYEVTEVSSDKRDVLVDRAVMKITDKAADEKESLKNYIEKVIRTRRGRYAAYGADFGIELGSTPDAAELDAAVKEALMQDERILNVHSVSLERDGERANAVFSVKTVYGDMEMKAISEDIE